MASYKAEIEVIAKGLGRVNQLNDAVSKLNRNVQAASGKTVGGGSRAANEQKLLSTLKLQTAELEKQLRLGSQIAAQAPRGARGAGGARGPGGGRGGRGGRRQDILTGFGFPLLFGGGFGQAVAGGIGGALGGLGGSIIASAAVQQVEKFVQGIAEAGQALDAFSGDVGKIAEMTGTAGNESIKYAKALEDLGFKQSALQIATQQAAQVIGTEGVGALQLFAEDTERLSEATARVGLKIQAFFAQALGGFTNLIAQIVERLGGAKPADTGNAPARALAVNQVTKFNKQKLNILRQEFEIKKLIGEEDAKQREVAEAKLAISKLDLQISEEKNKAAKAGMKDDIAGELQAKNAAFLLEKKKLILELELSQAEAAKRVYDEYTAQADALQGVVHQSKMRLDQEKAVLQGRNKLTQAYYGAELKINALAIQRKKQQVELYGLDGDRLDLLKLELLQVELIYRQRVAQIIAEVQQVRLQARQVRLATKQAEVDFLRKKAKGTLVKADYQALKLQYQALRIANYNVRVQEKVAEQQIKSAKATRAASKESLKFAYNQERAAKAAGRAAKAMKGAGGRGKRGDRYDDEVFGDYEPKGYLDRMFSFDIFGNPVKRYASQYGYTYTPMAEGGYVTRPTNALVGERGENEYVIPESKMGNAIKRYARGARGESVVEGSSETSAAGRKRSGAVVNISTGPVMQMGGQDYVTVSDLNDAVGNVAAAMSSSDEGYGSSARVS